MRKVLGAAAMTIGLFPATTAAQPQEPTRVPRSAAEERSQAPASQKHDELALPAPRKDPYGRLFTNTWSAAEAQLAAVQEVRAQPANSRRVVCGTTVIQADPSVDRRMVIPRVDDGTRPAIRTITPPVCWE